MAQLTKDISHLEQSLINLSSNPAAYNVSRAELLGRQKLTSLLQSELETLNDRFKTGCKYNALVDHARYSLSDECTTVDSIDSNTPLKDFQYVQDEIIKAQDDQLDYLEGTVHNLKSIGFGISDEIDLHQRLLGELNDAVENAGSRVHTNRTLMARISQRSSSSYLVCLIVVLIIILILLIFS